MRHGPNSSHKKPPPLPTQKYIPVLLGVLESAAEVKGPGPNDSSVLKQITAQVLIMQGANTKRNWFIESANYVHKHVANSTILRIPDAGHSVLLVKPEAVSVKMKQFFEKVFAEV